MSHAVMVIYEQGILRPLARVGWVEERNPAYSKLTAHIFLLLVARVGCISEASYTLSRFWWMAAHALSTLLLTFN